MTAYKHWQNIAQPNDFCFITTTIERFLPILVIPNAIGTWACGPPLRMRITPQKPVFEGVRNLLSVFCRLSSYAETQKRQGCFQRTKPFAQGPTSMRS